MLATDRWGKVSMIHLPIARCHPTDTDIWFRKARLNYHTSLTLLVREIKSEKFVNYASRVYEDACVQDNIWNKQVSGVPSRKGNWSLLVQLLHLSLKFRPQKLLLNVRRHMDSRAKTTNGHEIIRWVTSANQIPWISLPTYLVNTRTI